MAPTSKKYYFVAKPDVFLRSKAGGGSKLNHLLLGDWLDYVGPTTNGWARMRCRGDIGWLRDDEYSRERALEVNFVDIGQGDGCHIVTPDDEVILIDAGEGSNMERFLAWRYNLRRRNVARAPDFNPEAKEKAPWLIDHVVISHPDKDHYYGFRDVFENPKLKFKKIYHNGIVERPIAKKPDRKLVHFAKDDLGGYAVSGKMKYVWDVIDTNAKMKNLIEIHKETSKNYLKTLKACDENSPGASYTSLATNIATLGKKKFMGPFDGSGKLAFRVLGPITERISHDGETRDCLRKLGNEGVTKNGHSVILKLGYGKLSIMLGGDLNTQSQDFLLQAYTAQRTKASTLEKTVKKLAAQGHTISDKDQKKLDGARSKLNTVVAEARATFECDVTKACHHGSTHFSDTFLKAVNPTATVISSGDNEGYAHPRPDALGAFGKHGRGERPLIFSTELARSTNEFTPIFKHFQTLQDYMSRLDAAADKDERRKIQRDMENHKDRNVAVYGMITLRALGDIVILAQKLEAPGSNGTKWDIHELVYNDHRKAYEQSGH